MRVALVLGGSWGGSVVVPLGVLCTDIFFPGQGMDLVAKATRFSMGWQQRGSRDVCRSGRMGVGWGEAQTKLPVAFTGMGPNQGSMLQTSISMYCWDVRT